MRAIHEDLKVEMLRMCIRRQERIYRAIGRLIVKDGSKTEPDALGKMINDCKAIDNMVKTLHEMF